VKRFTDSPLHLFTGQGETMIDELREELYLYNLLRQLFLKEPTKDLVNEIAKIDPPDETDDEINKGLKLLIESVRKNESRFDAWIEELAIEYARLFIGPQSPPAVPYASFYLSESHSLMTDETIDVRKRYLEAGMAVNDLYSIPDDHIGIELEFVYYLTQKIIELFEQGQREDASRLFEIRSDFLSDHMASWLPLFADKVLESTQEDFYRGAAYLLRGAV
jgi:TorA maturation chaperone TorD